MRRFILSALALYLGVGDYSGEEARPLLGAGAAVVATPIALDRHDPARRRVGRLTWLGGWRLTSADRAFGSVSAMAVSGRRLTLLSDAGGVMAFDFDPRTGRASAVRFADLPDGPLGPAWSKDLRDSESMTLDPASGRIWVGFENVNQLWRYAPGFARAERFAAPAAMHAWPHSTGPEAMTRLRSGRFVIFAEAARGPRPGTNDALLFAGDPTDPAAVPVRFGYLRPPGFRVTDAAELPDGRLIVLHRKASILALRLGWIDGGLRIVKGVEALIRIVDVGQIGAGQALAGTDVAHLAWPLDVDNFEAIAVTQEEGRTIVWIASDDNYAFYQRTLLMKFALDEPAQKARPDRSRRAAASR